MMRYILPLACEQAELETVGGKGLSLSKMLTAGLPVPGGFHITTDAYLDFVRLNRLQPKIEAGLNGIRPGDTAGIEAMTAGIRAAFDEGCMPPELMDAISSAYRELGDVAVAVRSSATAEDLPDASFAGQQETYLNIRGEQGLAAVVMRCWASLWTARAVTYRLNNDIPQETVALAVVVQKLVCSDASGVMFTVNPVSGDRDEVIISAAWGLGESVVSGLVTPDTIIVSKDKRAAMTYNPADKLVMTIRTDIGTKEVPVPDLRRKEPALTAGQVMELADLGRRIERYYQMPMDIEWALEDGRLYIVQARPVTVLPPEWNPPEEQVIYTKGSLAEHLPGPVTPLFETLGLKLVNQASRILWEHMFGQTTAKLWPEHGAYIAINGYTYLSAKAKPALIAAKSLTPRSIRRVVADSAGRCEAARRDFATVVFDWEQKPVEELDAVRLLEGVRIVFGAACTYFTNIQLTLPNALMSETLFRKLFTKTAVRCGISDMSVFLLGFDTMALSSEQSVYDLAQWVKRDQVFTDYVKHTSARELEAGYEKDGVPAAVDGEKWEEWRNLLWQHLDMSGGTVYAFDFVNPTPREQLTPLMEVIRLFVSGQGESPYVRQAQSAEHRKQAEHVVLTRIRGPRRSLFERLLRWTQASAVMREDSIYHMGMGHPVVRVMLRELAARLIAGGALSRPDDIYWLREPELEELIGLLERGLSLPDMAACITLRQAEWKKWRSYISLLQLPEKKMRQSGIPESGKGQADGKTVLRGIGTSGGVVTAPACVVCGPSDFESFQAGDVLVAVTTTPAWTPLFATAAAVVTDIGGPLSHSSIVAREYGIPAVMAVHTATRAVKSGQLVTVDGNAGTVLIHTS